MNILRWIYREFYAIHTFFCIFQRTLISHSLAANFSLAMSTLCQFSWACFKIVLAKKIYFSKLNFRTQRWVLVFRLCSWLESATSQHLELLILLFFVLWWWQRHQQQWFNAGISFYFVFGFVLFADEKLFCFSAYGIAYRGKDIIMALIVFPIKFIFMYSSSVYKCTQNPLHAIFCLLYLFRWALILSASIRSVIWESAFSPTLKIRDEIHLLVSVVLLLLLFCRVNSNKFNCQFRSYFLSFSLK